MAFPSTKLDLKTEISVDGTWTDITSYTYGRNNVAITRGRTSETQDPDQSSCSLTLNNRDGRFSPRNPNGAWYGSLGRAVPFRVSLPSTAASPGYMDVWGLTDGAYAADHSSLDITGDIDLRVNVNPAMWNPDTSYTRDRFLLAKWDADSSALSYALALRGDGYLVFYWSTDGTTVSEMVSISPMPVPASGRLSVRATMDVNNGSSGWTGGLWYSTDTDLSSATWTLSGGAYWVGGPVTSIYSGSARLWVARAVSDGQMTYDNDTPRLGMPGRYYAAQVRSGIAGSIVANPDFTAQSSGTTSFADSAGRTWTLSAGAEIFARDCRFRGSLTNLPVSWGPGDDDVYCDATAYGVMQRLAKSSTLRSPVSNAVYNLAGTTSAVTGYWPCEDGSDSTLIASGLDGGPPMSYSGATPTFATDDTFYSSDALLQLNGATLSGKAKNIASTGEVQARMHVHIPAAGLSGSNNVLMRVYTTGSAAMWSLTYSGAELLTLRAYDSSGVNILTSAPIDYAGYLNGASVIISMSFTNSGSNVVWAVAVTRQDWDLYYRLGYGATLSSYNTGRAQKIVVNPYGTLTDTGVGQVLLLNDKSVLPVGGAAERGYVGEKAGDRVFRLCTEAGIPIRIVGNAQDSVPMGRQTSDTVLALCREAATTDAGVLAEARDFPGLIFYTRRGLAQRSTDLTLSYSGADPLAYQPFDDDSYLRNEVTATRAGGSSAVARQDVGPLQAAAPPDGPGVVSGSVTVSLNDDSTVAQHAGWRVFQGTVDQPRYKISIDQARSATLPDTNTIQALDLFHRIDVTDPPTWVPDDAYVLVQGITEALNAYNWTLDISAVPVALHDALVWDDSKVYDSRWADDGSTTLTFAVNSSATSFYVSVANWPMGMWTEDATDAPFDIVVGGERMTVGAVAPSSSGVQAFSSITRGVNNVTKSHSAGAAVALWRPLPWAL